MLTSKQRAYLRGLANKQAVIFQVGKAGVTPELTQVVNDALEARELIKITVLNTCPEEVASVAETLRGRTRSELVQVIGKKFILYRASKNKPVIILT